MFTLIEEFQEMCTNPLTLTTGMELIDTFWWRHQPYNCMGYKPYYHLKTEHGAARAFALFCVSCRKHNVLFLMVIDKGRDSCFGRNSSSGRNNSTGRDSTSGRDSVSGVV